jgi:hypothetical protein
MPTRRRPRERDNTTLAMALDQTLAPYPRGRLR